MSATEIEWSVFLILHPELTRTKEEKPQ